jgi:hypothetical protein
MVDRHKINKSGNTFGLLAIIILTSCIANYSNEGNNLNTRSMQVTPLLDNWKVFVDEKLGIKVYFPEDWNGPAIYVEENVIWLEIGTDNVYPYGTNLEYREIVHKNSYSIDIIYYKNGTGIKNTEGFKWFKHISDYSVYKKLLDLPNGQTILHMKSILSKVKNYSICNYRGVEYIETLPDYMETDYYYSRQLTIINDEYSYLEIIGEPQNVDIVLDENWRDSYRGVDEAYLDIYRQIINRIIFCTK